MTDNTGRTRPFDRAALDELLERAARRGERVRVAASERLPGQALAVVLMDRHVGME